jgi:hypothetical protein
MTAELEQAITAGGVRSINFFNGRLLTGDDLSREQEGISQARRRLGQALGEGIAYGLEVTEAGGAAVPTVRVEAGVAVNRAGEALELACRTDVSLAKAPAGGGPVQLEFTDCTPAGGGTYTAGSGVFLLLIGPSRSNEGRAEANGLTGGDRLCTVAFSVQGVRFRLVRLALPASVTADELKLRARVRDLMFGFGDPATPDPARDPFGTMNVRWGLVDALRARGDCLDDREVALAVLHWTATGGLRFVDNWAVRRRFVAPPSTGRWNAAIGDRRAAESEALLLAFQDHLEDLRAEVADPGTVRAVDRFDRLPPIGLVRVRGRRQPSGFVRERFFDGLTVRGPFFVEGQRVTALLQAALAHPPLDVAAKEAIWLYSVRENALRGERPYLLFVGGHVPYAAHAQYDLAHWDYANHALRLC